MNKFKELNPPKAQELAKRLANEENQKEMEDLFYMGLSRSEQKFLRKLIGMLKPQAITFEMNKLIRGANGRIPQPYGVYNTAVINTAKDTAYIVRLGKKTFYNETFCVAFETETQTREPLIISLRRNRKETMADFASYCGIKPEKTAWERCKTWVSKWEEVICFGVALVTAPVIAFALAALIPKVADSFDKEQLPAQVKTEDHRQWVLEQCSRPNLDEQTKQSCKNFFEE